MTLHPSDYPSHALLLLGFGFFYWSIAKVASLAAKNKEKLIEYSSYNPWFTYFKGRPMTTDEARKRLPPIFWLIYAWGGRIGRWIGVAIMSVSFLAFIVAIFKKFIV